MHRIIALFIFFSLAMHSYALQIKDVEHMELRDKSLLAASLGAGYAYSYFDTTQSFKQDNSLVYRDAVNTIGLGSQIIAADLSSPTGRFNAVLEGGYDRYVLPWLHAFAYSSYESYVIASLTGQFQGGAGVKTVLLKTSIFHFDISLAPTYVHSTYINLPQRDDLSATIRTRLRWSIIQGLTLVIPYAFLTGVSNARDQWHSVEPSLSYRFHENADISAEYRYRYNAFNHAYAGVFSLSVTAHLKN